MTSPGASLVAFLGPDAAAAVACLGADVVAWAPANGERPPTAVRGAARATLSDGREVKVRRLPTAADAARVRALLDHLDDPRLPRALATSGRALVEPWVVGEPLPAGGLAPADAAALGALLGAVHATPSALGARCPAPGTTAHRRARLAVHLEDLVGAAVLAAAEARAVAAAVAATDPVTVAVGVVHGDLSPHNVVRAPDGRLVAVDNEMLGLGPLEGDLVRCLVRSEPGPAARAALLAAYAAWRDPAPALAAERCFTLLSLVKSLHVRAVRWRVDPGPARARLRAALDGPATAR